MIDVLYTLAPSIVILSALMILSGREKSDPTRTRAIAHNKYIRVFLLLALTVLLARYGWWRIGSSLPEFTWSLEGIWSRVYFAAEVIGLIAAATMYVWLMRRTDRHEQANRGEQLLTGGSKPRICILIPTYNEPETILEKTIIGATSQNYDNYAVYALDDNRRKNIKELCKLHGVGYIDRDSNEGA